MPRVLTISFNSKCIGKFVSNSKQRLTWILEIDGIEHTIALTLSFVSRKFEIFVNGISHKAGKEIFKRVSYDFKLMNCLFIIESNFSTTVFKVNGTLFEKLPKKDKQVENRRRATEELSNILNKPKNKPSSSNLYSTFHVFLLIQVEIEF